MGKFEIFMNIKAVNIGKVSLVAIGMLLVQQGYASQEENAIIDSSQNSINKNNDLQGKNIQSQIEKEPTKPLNDSEFLDPPSLIQPVIAQAVATPLPVSDDSNLESQIEIALINENWQYLEELLAVYKTFPRIDQTLYDYAIGAKLRSEGKHAHAIAYYERITKDPALIYPAFDLAVMYFEDKQYRNAERIFTRIAPQMPAPMQAVIVQYLSAIRSAQSVTPSLELNYERNNNVNNASELSKIKIGELSFDRDEASKPQSGEGVHYNAGVSLNKNLVGNHYFYSNLGADGVYYWNNKDYSEFSLQADIGYHYKDVLKNANIVPFVAKSTLGKNPYYKQYGINVTYSEKITPTLQSSIKLSYIDKRYANQATANRYDGVSRDGAFVLSYHPSSHWLWHMGLDARREDLKDASESSTRLGMRLGATYADNDMGVRVLARIAKRDFSADNFWYRRPRVDIEKQATTTIWHNKLSWRGITPSLNYRWQQTDSNLSLYDRNVAVWFVGLEKSF